MSRTKIEWADAVWNPVTGCTPVSEGCQNCYAKRIANRFGQEWFPGSKCVELKKPVPKPGGGINPYPHLFNPTLHKYRLNEPLKWKKPRRVFVCSMGDLFHEDVPHEFIDYVFAVMGRSQQHTFILLTKRPERMREYLQAGRYQQILNIAYRLKYRPEGLGKGIDNPKDMRWWPNVWLGVTAENQQRADERIPILLQIPAAVRFVSVEPMLGPIDLTKLIIPITGPRSSQPCAPETWRQINALTGDDYQYDWKCHGVGHQGPQLNWIICGSESGPNHRKTKIEWIRDLREQCISANVPFFLKQMEINGRMVKMPELDGKIWAQFPEIIQKEA